MTNKLFYLSHLAVANDYQNACDWFKNNDIQYSNTRIQKYKFIIEELAKVKSKNELYDAYEKINFSKVVNAIYEIAEISEIYHGLKHVEDREFINRLSKIVKGRELFATDVSNTKDRDFSYELKVVSKFSRAGCHVDFGDDADIKTIVDGSPFFVECKRLKSDKKIQRRISEAMKQLHKRYSKSEYPSKARGILSISISKLMNKDLGIIERRSSTEIGNIVTKHIEGFILKYRRYWEKSTDKRTIGVVVHLDVPGIIQDKSMLITSHQTIQLSINYS